MGTTEKEIIVKYTTDSELTREELKILSTLSIYKPILQKIVDKSVRKLIVDSLNIEKQINKDYIKGYERAFVAFLSNFK
jgi:hypothetical protein